MKKRARLLNWVSANFCTSVSPAAIRESESFALNMAIMASASSLDFTTGCLATGDCGAACGAGCACRARSRPAAQISRIASFQIVRLFIDDSLIVLNLYCLLLFEGL